MLEEISHNNVDEMAMMARTDDDGEVGGVYEPAGNEDFQARFLKNLTAKREEVAQALTRLIASQKAYGKFFLGGRPDRGSRPCRSGDLRIDILQAHREKEQGAG